MTKIFRRTHARFVCAVLLMFGSFPTPTFGCSVFKPFHMNNIQNAEVVFRGELTEYQPGTVKLSRAATLTFKVIQTLRGPERAEWIIGWRNATFGTPTNWRRSTNQIVAAKTRTIEGQVSKSADVLQESCTLPFLFDDTDANRTAVESALKRHP